MDSRQWAVAYVEECKGNWEKDAGSGGSFPSAPGNEGGMVPGFQPDGFAFRSFGDLVWEKVGYRVLFQGHQGLQMRHGNEENTYGVHGPAGPALSHQRVGDSLVDCIGCRGGRDGIRAAYQGEHGEKEDVFLFPARLHLLRLAAGHENGAVTSVDAEIFGTFGRAGDFPKSFGNPVKI